MTIFSVDLTKEVTYFVFANDADEAEGIAWDLAYDDEPHCWDTSASACVVEHPNTNEWIETEDGSYQYGDLLKLEEWIALVDEENAVDPNQGVLL